MKKRNNLLILTLIVILSTALILTSCGIKDGGYPPPSTGTDYANGDSFESFTEMPFTDTATKADISFGLHVNTASYSYLRKCINENKNIEPTAVRIEEMVNYFSYNYEKPENGLGIGGQIFDTPWNKNTKLLTVNVNAEELKNNDIANNIVFLIDISGSMQGKDKIDLLKSSIGLMLEQLDENDKISIVTYASGVKTILNGANGSEQSRIRNAIESLKAEGSTNGSGGIQLAYEVAQGNYIQNGNNRVVLCSDGDFNVGITDFDELIDFISDKKDIYDTYLSVLGFGSGNLRDDIMSNLAKNGNGSYHYIDSLTEARKALVENLDSELNIIAKDAKANVTFNKDMVSKYRIIGYETTLMTDEDWNNTNKDAGEIGAGHSVTAVFEIMLTKGALERDDEIAKTAVKYKTINENVDEEITRSFTKVDYGVADDNNSFIACVVEFGLIMRNSQYAEDADLARVYENLGTLESVKNDFYKNEFFELIKKFIKNQGIIL